MYFSTMWTYLSGFAAVVYFAAPIIYLTLGILPVNSISFDFFIRFIPFMVVNQLLFLVAGHGIPTWRGQQYSLALFPPTWIKACTTAARNVWFGRPLGFAVTPKARQSGGPSWSLIRPQIIVAVLLAVALVVGLIRLLAGMSEPPGHTGERGMGCVRSGGPERAGQSSFVQGFRARSCRARAPRGEECRCSLAMRSTTPTRR